MQTEVVPLVVLALWPALGHGDASLPPTGAAASIVRGGVRFTPTMTREGARRVRIRTVAEAVDGVAHRLPLRPLTTSHHERCGLNSSGGGEGMGGPTVAWYTALVIEPGRPQQLEDRVIELAPWRRGCVRSVDVEVPLIDERRVAPAAIATVIWSFAHQRANVGLRVPSR